MVQMEDGSSPGDGCHRLVAARHILSKRRAGVSRKVTKSDLIVITPRRHCLKTFKSSSCWHLPRLQLPACC